MVKLCDKLLADLSLRTGVMGKMTQPTFAATARQLGTTTRTLCRRIFWSRQGLNWNCSFLKSLTRVHMHISYVHIRLCQYIMPWRQKTK